MAKSYFSDRAHLLIAGVTGARTDYGGKTALATWWADNWGRQANDLVIFGNYKLDSSPERHADAVAGSVEELADPIREGKTFICLSPRSSDWEAVSRRLRSAVDALPSDMPKMVVHDETPEHDPEALAWFARVAGNGANCKSLFLAQAPGDLPKTIRRQTILVWVGPATGDDKGIFVANNRGAHFEHVLDQEPYHWSVLLGPDPSDRDQFDPVPEEYAG